MARKARRGRGHAVRAIRPARTQAHLTGLRPHGDSGRVARLRLSFLHALGVSIFRRSSNSVRVRAAAAATRLATVRGDSCVGEHPEARARLPSCAPCATAAHEAMMGKKKSPEVSPGALVRLAPSAVAMRRNRK